MKKLPPITLTLLLALQAFVACSQAPSTTPHSTRLDPYLAEVFSLLEQQSILAPTVNWAALKESTLTDYPVVATDSQRYAIIRHVLKTQQLKHHGFMDPAQTKAWKNQPKKANAKGQARQLQYPTYTLLHNQIGHIVVPGFPTGDSLALNKYARTLQSHISTGHQQGVTQWIIDLRGNFGGHMWPMLVGLGPLLGHGKLGSFATNGAEAAAWYYDNGKGKIIEGGQASYYVNITPLLPVLHNQKIAVLCNEGTASSGEAVLVAFTGKAGATTIGTQTAGYSTANDMIPLSNGATLIVTTAVYMDSNGVQYPNDITPAVLTNADDIMDKAVNWLLNH